jgi:hypothetical protein
MFAELIVVECVQGMPGLDQDEVCDVHDIVDGALTRGHEALLEPVWGWDNRDVVQNPPDVSRAKVWVENGH